MGPRPTRRGSRCSLFVGRASSHDLGRAGTLALQGPPGAFSEERSIWLRTGNRASLRMGYLIQWPDPSLALRACPEPRRDDKRCSQPLHSRHQPRSGIASRNDIVSLFLLEAPRHRETIGKLALAAATQFHRLSNPEPTSRCLYAEKNCPRAVRGYCSCVGNVVELLFSLLVEPRSPE